MILSELVERIKPILAERNGGFRFAVVLMPRSVSGTRIEISDLELMPVSGIEVDDEAQYIDILCSRRQDLDRDQAVNLTPTLEVVSEPFLDMCTRYPDYRVFAAVSDPELEAKFKMRLDLPAAGWFSHGHAVGIIVLKWSEEELVKARMNMYNDPPEQKQGS